MIYELRKKRDEKVEKVYKKAMKDLDNFFKLNWKRNLPPVILLKNRKDIDTFWGGKTKDWVVAFAKENTIYILNKKNYEKESSHKYSDREYSALIKHELCHLFFQIISGSNSHNQFVWFNEGVAGFLSEQHKNKSKPVKFKLFLNQYSTWKGDAYSESSYAVKFLVDRFGKEKLLNLIKSLSKVRYKKDFDNLFKKIYGSKPTYKFFNNLIK